MATLNNMTKVTHAMFDDDHRLLEAAAELVSKGVKIREVYSPFPIHGLDPVIGVKRTRIAIVSFMFGLTGLSLGLLGMWYFMISDWPLNIGGKPSFSLIENIPAFVPVAFEFTVLCAAHGMAITYMLRNGTLPGVEAINPDPRTTDDKFVMEIADYDQGNLSNTELNEMLKSVGAIEINEKELSK